MTSWKPADRPTVMPYLLVNGAEAAVAFAETVVGASLIEDPLRHADGTIWNAELKIGDSVVMVAEGRGVGPVPGFLYVYVEDCDAAYRRAIEAGATSILAPETQFYGDRNAGVRDAAGNIWWFATHVEDVSSEDLKARAAAYEARPAG